jgi:hypothetical protein
LAQSKSQESRCRARRRRRPLEDHGGSQHIGGLNRASTLFRASNYAVDGDWVTHEQRIIAIIVLTTLLSTVLRVAIAAWRQCAAKAVGEVT